MKYILFAYLGQFQIWKGKKDNLNSRSLTFGFTCLQFYFVEVSYIYMYEDDKYLMLFTGVCIICTQQDLADREERKRRQDFIDEQQKKEADKEQQAQQEIVK